jgi:hypothetical protein
MYVDINHLELLKFKGCEGCIECCKKPMAPLILEDFDKVYKYFPILIAELDTFKPVMLLSNEISCPYLKNGQCTIYENRPPACRIYPYSPWYDKILLDLGCNGVGTEGKQIPLTKEEFFKSGFYEERFENINTKILKTQKWLKKKKLIYFTTYYNIKLYKTDNNDDMYDKKILRSFIHLNKYFGL